MENNTGTAAALTQPRTVLVPLLNLSVATELVHLAAALVAGVNNTPPAAARVIVLGVVEVPPDEPLAAGRSMARAYRALLGFLPNEVSFGAEGAAGSVPIHHTVRVAHSVATGIREAALDTETDLLLLHWKGYASDPALHSYGETTDDLLRDPPANILLARPGGWEVGRRIFVPVRGGPAAELALDIGLVLARRLDAELTVMHSVPRACALEAAPGDAASSPISAAEDVAVAATGRLRGDEPYLALAARLTRLEAEGLVPLEHVLTVAEDVGVAVAAEAGPTDLVVLGTPGVATGEDPALHPVVGRVLETPGRPVFLVRARHSLDLAAYQRAHGGPTSHSAITAEQWFVENTYHADEFKKQESWQHLKQAQHARVSVVLPTLNDGSRLIRLLTGLRTALMEHAALADEIVVVDAGSTDDTPALVHAAGFPLLALPEREPLQPPGPGAVLACALPSLVGDLVVWLDPKAVHLDARLVMVLTAPLLTDPAVQLVKPFSAAPESDDPTADPSPPGARFSRITPADLLSLTSGELAALPLHAWFRAFFPMLGALVEPTGRIFAARRAWLLEILESVTTLPARSVAESVVFNAALVLETVARQGVRAIAQVEFEQRKSRRTRTASAGADLRQLRQVSALLDLFATRSAVLPHARSLQQLQAHLASLGEL